jgi:hypothetical protein
MAGNIASFYISSTVVQARTEKIAILIMTYEKDEIVDDKMQGKKGSRNM